MCYSRGELHCIAFSLSLSDCWWPFWPLRSTSRTPFWPATLVLAEPRVILFLGPKSRLMNESPERILSPTTCFRGVAFALHWGAWGNEWVEVAWQSRRNVSPGLLA